MVNYTSLFRFNILVYILTTLILSPATIAKTDNPEWLNFTSKASIYAICDVGEYIWIGGTGLTKIHKTTGTMLYYNKANSGLPNNRILALAYDTDGNLLI